MNTILILAIAILLIISIVILIKNKKSKKEPIDVVPDNTTTTTLSPPTTTVSTKTWWATGNSGSCGDPCGQQVYTALGFTYLNVSYFYNTSDLTPDDYYAPGSGTIGFTDQSYGNAIYTANIAIDGSMSSNDACLTTTTTTTATGYYVVGDITEGSSGDDVGSQFAVEPTGNSVSFDITVKVTISGSPETRTHSYSYSDNESHNFSWSGLGWLDSGTDIQAKLNSSVSFDVRVNCSGPGDTNCVNLTTSYQTVDTVS